MSKVFEEGVRHDRFAWEEGDITIENPDGTIISQAKGFDLNGPIPPQPEPTADMERERRRILRREESGALDRLAHGLATKEEIEADTVIDDGDDER